MEFYQAFNKRTSPNDWTSLQRDPPSLQAADWLSTSHRENILETWFSMELDYLQYFLALNKFDFDL